MLIEGLKTRAEKVGVSGNREYNNGWHMALDLDNLLTVSEAITRAAIERKESVGGHLREDFPEKVESFGKFNFILRKGQDGEMKATFRIWRGDPKGGAFQDIDTEVSEGVVVLDAVHRIQAEEAIARIFRRSS